MLKYESIYAVNHAILRLQDNKRDRYGWSREKTRDSDRLTVFTLEPQAEKESLGNLATMLDLGRRFNQSYLVFTDRKIQLLGTADTDINGVSAQLDPEDWRRQYEQWGQDTGLSRVRSKSERSSQGVMAQLATWKRCLALAKHQGVYSIESGNKLTNRREIIAEFWDHGFAAMRGRPLSVAPISQVGERSELEEITNRAETYLYRRGYSEAARKMVTNFTSLNRIAAWPGAW